MKINISDLKGLLMKSNILGAQDSINLTEVPINNRKKREYRTKETYLWINNELKYIINDKRLGPINYKSYCLLKQQCGDLVCKVVKLSDKDKRVFLTEYFEGQTIRNALESGAITKSNYIAFAEEVHNRLSVTEKESTALKAEREYKSLLKQINAIDIIEDFDKKLLNYLAKPIFNKLIRDKRPKTRITSGDFHDENILINKSGILKLIDLEFVAKTHFYEEDWVRFNHLSNIDLKDRIKKKNIGERYDSFEFFFLLKQIALEYKLSTPYLFFKNWPSKIERIINIAKELELFPKDSILNIITPDDTSRAKTNQDNWQIFWKVDGQFTENNSVLGKFEPNSNVTVEFDLKRFVQPVEIRFDPSTDVGEITVDKIYLRERKNNGKCINIERSSLLEDGDIVEIDRKNGRFLSIGSDPRMSLPEITPGFDELVIRLRYKKQLTSVKEINEKLKKSVFLQLQHQKSFLDLENRCSSQKKENEANAKSKEKFKLKLSEILKHLPIRDNDTESIERNLKLVNEFTKANTIALEKANNIVKLNEKSISKLESKIKYQQSEAGTKDKNQLKLLEEIKKLEKKTFYLGAKLENTNLELQEAKRERSGHLTELGKLEKTNSALEAKLQNNNLELRELKGQKGGHLAVIKRLEKANSSLEQKLGKNSLEIGSVQKERKQSLLELKGIKKINSTLKNQITKSDIDFCYLKQNLDEKVKLINEQVIENKENKQNLERASSDITYLEEELATKQNDLTQIYESLKRTEDETRETFEFINKISTKILNINYIRSLGNEKEVGFEKSKELAKSRLENVINLLVIENSKLYKEIKILRKFSLGIESKLSNKTERLDFVLAAKERLKIDLIRAAKQKDSSEKNRDEIEIKYKELKQLYNTVEGKAKFLHKANKNHKLAYLEYKSMYANITDKGVYNLLKKLKIV